MVDHVHVAWRCTCPSRSQPCKHALALLAMWVRGQVPSATAPAHVTAWVEAHARREMAAAAPAAAAATGDGPEPAEAVAEQAPGRTDLDRSRNERVARLRHGLVELDRWLDDRLRTGLSDPALARYTTWDFARCPARRCPGWRAGQQGAPPGRARRRPSGLARARAGRARRAASARRSRPTPRRSACSARRCRRHGLWLAGPAIRRAVRSARHRRVDRGRSQRHPRGPHRGAPYVAVRAVQPALGDGPLIRRLSPDARFVAACWQPSQRRPASISRPFDASTGRHGPRRTVRRWSRPARARHRSMVRPRRQRAGSRAVGRSCRRHGAGRADARRQQVGADRRDGQPRAGCRRAGPGDGGRRVGRTPRAHDGRVDGRWRRAPERPPARSSARRRAPRRPVLRERACR